jgi:tetratricopeptide (TPR) repeat protein
MTRYAVPLLAAALLTLGGLSAPHGSRLRGEDSDKKVETKPQANGPKDDAARVEMAELAEAKGEYLSALKHYVTLKARNPKWAAIQFKIAACHAALDEDDKAISTLREVLKMKSASAELVSQARAALQELLVQKMTPEVKKMWQQALAQIQAGEELKKHDSEDHLEIRLEHKLAAGPFREAVALLEKIVAKEPNFTPAHLSLGVAYENLSNFTKAFQAYSKFLDLTDKEERPAREQQAQVRQRQKVCERRAEVDHELSKKCRGRWIPSALAGDKWVSSGGIAFGDGGTVQRFEKGMWEDYEPARWEVIGKHIIYKVTGDYVIAPLPPDCGYFEGVNLKGQKVRWEKDPKQE